LNHELMNRHTDLIDYQQLTQHTVREIIL